MYGWNFQPQIYSSHERSTGDDLCGPMGCPSKAWDMKHGEHVPWFHDRKRDVPIKSQCRKHEMFSHLLRETTTFQRDVPSKSFPDPKRIGPFVSRPLASSSSGCADRDFISSMRTSYYIYSRDEVPVKQGSEQLRIPSGKFSQFAVWFSIFTWGLIIGPKWAILPCPWPC